MLKSTLVAITLLAPIAAHAEEPSRDTGLYLRAGAGAVFGESISQDLAWNPAFVSIVPLPFAKSTELSTGLSLSAAVGFQYRKTRTELEYRRFQHDIDTVSYSSPFPFVRGPNNDEFTTDALMSNVYFDFVNASCFTPYVGVGVGGARIENDVSERDTAFAYQGRVGVEAALRGGLSVGVEYSYFRTLELSYGPKEFNGASSGIGPRTDGAPFASSAVMGVVRVQF